MEKAQQHFNYDVCLSYAAEDRSYVKQVADRLRKQRIRVFYDEYEKAQLWGKDLYTHLDEIYRHSARFCILFISTHYARKMWTNHERQSAQARAFMDNEEYILPARFDDTEIPGIRNTVGYIDLRGTSPAELTSLVLAKLDFLPRSAVFIDGDCLLASPTRRVKSMNFELLFARLKKTFGENVSVFFYLGPARKGFARKSFISKLETLGYLVEGTQANESEDFVLKLALRTSELPANVHTLALVSADRELAPLLQQAKAAGRRTFLIAPPLASMALRKAADSFLSLDEFLMGQDN